MVGLARREKSKARSFEGLSSPEHCARSPSRQASAAKGGVPGALFILRLESAGCGYVQCAWLPSRSAWPKRLLRPCSAIVWRVEAALHHSPPAAAMCFPRSGLAAGEARGGIQGVAVVPGSAGVPPPRVFQRHRACNADKFPFELRASRRQWSFISLPGVGSKAFLQPPKARGRSLYAEARVDGAALMWEHGSGPLPQGSPRTAPYARLPAVSHRGCFGPLPRASSRCPLRHRCTAVELPGPLERRPRRKRRGQGGAMGGLKVVVAFAVASVVHCGTTVNHGSITNTHEATGDMYVVSSSCASASAAVRTRPPPPP